LYSVVAAVVVVAVAVMVAAAAAAVSSQRQPMGYNFFSSLPPISSPLTGEDKWR